MGTVVETSIWQAKSKIANIILEKNARIYQEN